MTTRCLGCMESFNPDFRVCPYCGYVIGTNVEEAIHIMPGIVIKGRYTVGKVLGYGGFGVTYIGWDSVLEQKVAIKEYLPSEFSTRMPGQSRVTVFGGDKAEQFGDGLRKFVDEAKRLANFKNEHGIVKIFDSFLENETAYIVMEYLDGETLTEFLDKVGILREEEAVQMLMPIMNSLQTVHEIGLLHRDIAPDNIFLTRDGEVKLIDFGASRFATTSHSRSLTAIIKPGYSPEEQYRSRGDQGPHTDVYALGATLYRMITGKRPPDAMGRREQYETANKDILEEPHKYAKKISRAREIAILNAMNVRIEDRTATVSDFISELEADPPAKRRYGKIKKIDLYHWPLWLKILLPALLAVIITFTGLLLGGVIDFSVFVDKLPLTNSIVSVPNVEQKELMSAIEELKNANLSPKVGDPFKTKYVSAGYVVYQTPIGGSYAKEGDEIILSVGYDDTVYEPSGNIAFVPYVQNFDVDEAKARLAQAGLNSIVVEEYSDEFEKGKVISQPEDVFKEVDVGTEIKITVSKGPKSFALPDFVGKKESKDIKDNLNELGLRFEVAYENSEDVDKGIIMKQNPKAGTEVARGDKITLVISAGKSETVVVPDVIGMKSGDAESILKGADFKVVIVQNYSDSVAAGKVIDTSLKVGTSQVRGVTITLFVSKGKAPEVIVTEPTTTVPPTTVPPPTTQAPTTVPSTTQAPTTQPVTAISDWVKASEVPVGAKIVERKYIYDVTDYTTSYYNSLSGYTLDTSKGNNGVTYDYSDWHYGDWVTEQSSESDIVVKYDEKVEEKVTGYKMYTYMTQENAYPHHRMYRDYSIKANLAAYGARESYGEHYFEANWTVDQFNRAKNSINDRESRGGGEIAYAGKNYGNKMLYYLPGSGWEHMYFIKEQEISKTTYYKYKTRTKTTVYNYKKVETKDSSSYPSGSNISNIQEWVKYSYVVR